MLIPLHGMKLCAHCFIWREALCSLLCMKCGFVKLFAHYETWSEALFSMLYKE